MPSKARKQSALLFLLSSSCNLGQFHPINFSRNCPGAFSTTNARPRQMPCPSPPLSEDGFRGAWSEGEGEGLKAPRTPPFPSHPRAWSGLVLLHVTACPCSCVPTLAAWGFPFVLLLLSFLATGCCATVLHRCIQRAPSCSWRPRFCACPPSTSSLTASS